MVQGEMYDSQLSRGSTLTTISVEEEEILTSLSSPFRTLPLLIELIPLMVLNALATVHWQCY
jgi:hypothetical protein